MENLARDDAQPSSPVLTHNSLSNLAFEAVRNIVPKVKKRNRKPRRISVRRNSGKGGRSGSLKAAQRLMSAGSAMPRLNIQGKALAQQRIKRLLRDRAARAIDDGIDDSAGEVHVQVCLAVNFFVAVHSFHSLLNCTRRSKLRLGQQFILTRQKRTIRRRSWCVDPICI